MVRSQGICELGGAYSEILGSTKRNVVALMEGLEEARPEMGKSAGKCAVLHSVVQVTKPRSSETKERGEPGGEVDMTWL